MMKHQLSKTANETEDYNGSLSEPHFDDEATLLSARRVVPFHKLTGRKNFKKKLFFGTALAVALMIGIIGGVNYARLERTPASRAETTEAASQPLSQDDLVSSSQETGESASVNEESKTPVAAKSDQKTIDKPRHNSTIVQKSVSLNPSPARPVHIEPDERDYSDERAIRRAEQRAARRARREAAREAQHSEDLFRIQEIFEGSSRP